MTVIEPPSVSETAVKRTLNGYALTVFLSSALLLVLEIVAGRLVAPYVGVSLYTWTSIIGVILAGLSLGNWIGGVWADRGGSGRSVGMVLVAGGLYCILSLAMLDALGAALQASGATLLTASFVFASVLFFVPAALIGVVTPLLTTLSLRLDDRAGHVIGRMHALAAVGSISGTFAAGYWLVQALGTRTVVLTTGLLLLALGAPFLRGIHRAAQVLLVVAVLATGLLVGLRQGLASSCDRESSYFCIRVVDQSADAPFGEARGLVLDHLLHGINHRDQPAMLIAPYVHGIDELAYAHFGERYDAGLRWFFAGGGAYTQPRALQVLSPDSQITVAELDPAVTRTAVERLYLNPDGMQIVHRDARLALLDAEAPFDVVVGDVFHDVAIPYHLVTKEFAALVKARLRPGGLYAMNVVDAFPDPLLIKAIVKTLASEFSYVDLWMEGPPEAARVTFIVTASDARQLPKTVAARGSFPRSWTRMTEDLMAFGRSPRTLPLLTDNYAPVERLISDLLIGDAR
ncbi:MAG: fused MFS/spermidine synthase [Thiohalocapsa sp.]|nr:fused MFS/spermidine synthase [Thiohalocapsa sp.]